MIDTPVGVMILLVMAVAVYVMYDEVRTEEDVNRLCYYEFGLDGAYRSGSPDPYWCKGTYEGKYVYTTLEKLRKERWKK